MKNLDSILPISDEGLYPIRTVSEVSGVNAITLRAWERRYGLFSPKRTPKGHRLYSEKDIHRIRQVLQLLAKGVSIGRVANALKNEQHISNMPELMVAEPLVSDSVNISEEQWDNYQSRLMNIVTDYDIAQLEVLHHELLSVHSIETVSHCLISPVLKSLAGRASQLQSLSGDYYFYKSFIEQRIGGLFLKSSVQNTGPKVLLMGIRQQCSDAELLLFAMPLLNRGFQIVLLGASVPFDAIPMALSASNSEGLILFSNDKDALNEEAIEAMKTVVASASLPVFLKGEYSDIREKQLLESGLIILPQFAAEQAVSMNNSFSLNTD